MHTLTVGEGAEPSRHGGARAALALGFALACALAHGADAGLAASYRFLVTDRAAGGALITATAGALAGARVPLSFVDTAAYWGDYVCRLPGHDCRVRDAYDAADHTLRPPLGRAGDLQTERVNVHNGANIYDAATWQIAVMLGPLVPGFAPTAGSDTYALASGQNLLLAQAHDAEAPHFRPGTNRAVTVGELFVYNGHAVSDWRHAYAFRMFARRWLAEDPLGGTRFAALVAAEGLPAGNSEYRAGRISWTDWKPFTGENAWAFLIGPLQAAYLHHVRAGGRPCVPFAEPALRSALALLPTFAAMQSPLGGVHYAPSGTLRNEGELPVDTREIVVENNASLYAGLRLLEATLRATLAHDARASATQREAMRAALALIDTMIRGGRIGSLAPTAGLLAFFREHAWRDGEFLQGGLAQDPRAGAAWLPTSGPRAVDANTWTVAALGAGTVDAWFGFGAAYANWQRVKQWGGYGEGGTLRGVGFSEIDGNGIAADGSYRQGVMSSEWTAGAINLLRSLIAHYGAIAPDAPQYATARAHVESLARDEASMRAGLEGLRIDRYPHTDFPGRPADHAALVPPSPGLLPYVYASRRHAIPFGWHANPLPSTCATAWAIMLAAHYDPFGYGGRPN